ncbi:MAG: PilZ domain-containing protein [Bacillota bacterium]
MNIRAQIFGSSRPEEPIFRDKRPKGAKADSLHSVSVSREESRRGNSRTEDRHRLSEESVTVTHAGASHEAQLINVSGGGAMIRGALDVKLWDKVELRLGEDGTIDCAVRWIRGDRIGLEFAHETRLDCSSDEMANVLRDVITRSFPDARFEAADEDHADPEPAAEDDPLPERRSGERRAADRRVRSARGKPGEHRRATRHPLIWSGTLHLDDQSTTVRVRNISSTGAMIECREPLAPGAEPVLQLNDEAALGATVQWVVGSQVGLKFHRPFDMQLLGRSKPEVAAAPTRWLRPAYLDTSNNEDESDPWDPRWQRLTMREINLELEGFLKR